MQNDGVEEISFIEVKTRNEQNDNLPHHTNIQTPQNEPYLTYLDSTNDQQILEAINYFSKNIKEIDEFILDKLLNLMTDKFTSPLLLSTIGNAILYDQSLVGLIHYNAIQASVIEYFNIVNDEYPFFERIDLAESALNFTSKYSNLSTDNNIELIEGGILDSLKKILTVFQQQPDEEPHIQCHASILLSTFKLIGNLFRDPFLLPSLDEEILTTMQLCLHCIENIKTPDESISINNSFKNIFIKLIKGAHNNDKLLNQFLILLHEYLQAEIQDSENLIKRSVVDILLAFSGVENDIFCQHLFENGFFPILFQYLDIDDNQMLASIIRIFYNISACSDIHEFKQELAKDEVIEKLITLLDGSTVQIMTQIIKILNNLNESEIISLTPILLDENNCLLEKLIDCLQYYDFDCIKTVASILCFTIGELRISNDSSVNGFMEKLLVEYELDDEIQNILQLPEKHPYEVDVLYGEIQLFINSTEKGCIQNQNEEEEQIPTEPDDQNHQELADLEEEDCVLFIPQKE